ncbi:cytochrome b/b6 domain-containing protein [Diaminobutyricimonas sp. TR449]|uniref:cytochrome b/b6 domain-containing protein n=1 Tax=Diaminobutyricimonas sp. TR449 TaxID=2708076 RepID=UPI00141E9632|nr:cytochrome b/b6 domain-containing protein [Diaminobutyricimonas sp. TR449]
MSSTADLLSTFRASPWFKLVWIAPAGIILLLAVVLGAQALRSSDVGQDFLTSYPGESHLPEWAPVGFPAWLAWQHGINAFLMVFIIKSGWMVRTTQRPSMYWTRNNSGPIRTKNPPKKLSIDLWFHITTDTLWVLNGIVFFVLLFSTGQWTRIVPTSWDVFPNAISAAIQYASLNWPTEDGWVNYNALQLLSYFAIVMIVAPLSILTGVRMSPSWPKNTLRLNTVFPIEAARRMHFPLMLVFVAFTLVHVALVLATGALRNLNHMYAAADETNWVGFGIFAASIVAIVATWIALRPMSMRAIASTMGAVSRN